MTNSNHGSAVSKGKKIRSVFYRIFLILIASLTVGLSFYSWNASRVVGNQLPMPFGFGASVVLSGSMEPTLNVNDLVFITASDDYQEGDVVVYQNGNELIIHRIVAIDDEMVITKGDANPVTDNPISKEAIKGKYSFRIPYIGLLLRFIKTLPGTLLILALVVFLMYRSRKKERQSSDEELEKIAEEIRQLRSQQLSQENTDADLTAVEQQSDDADNPEESQPDDAADGEENQPADSDEQVDCDPKEQDSASGTVDDNGASCPDSE